MSAVSCCSGGVMFVPEKIKREVKSRSYADLAGETAGDVPARGKILGGADAPSGAEDSSVSASA